MADDNKTYRVLSCDAGGARGILSLCFLEQFEKETGKFCHDLFDLFAGTSTGSIIAGLLSSPLEFEGKKISAEKVLEKIYRERGKKFFKKCLQRWYKLWN